MNLTSELRSLLPYSLMVAAVLAAVLTVSYLSTRQSSRPLQLSDYYSYRCGAEPSLPDREFRILTVARTEARALADSLCSNPAFSAVYPTVSIRWQRRDYLTLDHIQEQSFELFFNRQHVVSGIAPNYTLFYSLFHDSPHYTLEWISDDDQPQLSDDYFRHRTLGLLSDPKSQSYHIMPLDTLNAAGIQLPESRIIYFSDTYSLYQAFSSGRVDVIPVPRVSSSAQIPFRAAYRLLISDDMSPGSWYLSQRVSAAVHCDLQNVLNRYGEKVFDHETDQTDCR
ncbi:MAG: hypothetical protein KYX62_09755 [Pseudomonadota bacterium]|nr:hypothetical protein [Pseudomonadota bacterium]